MVEKAKDEGELTFEKWDKEYSSEKSDEKDFESAGEESVVDNLPPGYRTNRPFIHSCNVEDYFSQDSEWYRQHLGSEQNHKTKGASTENPGKLGGKKRSDRTKAKRVPATWQQDQ